MAYTPSCMHASMHMALLQALSILLLASMLVPAGSAEEAPSGYHVDANGGFTREELIRPAVDRTHLRAAMPISANLTTEVDRGHYEYLMELKIGTLPEPFRAVADTGSDYVWTKQLKSCDRSSSTFTLAPACSESSPDRPCNYCCEGLCMFKKTYGNNLDTVKGFMGNAKLTLSADNENSIDFGCAINISKRVLPESADGIVGLNRGPMSLVKQLKITKFSYCLSNPLGPSELKKSPLWFGGDVPAPSDRWNSTPLVPIEDKTSVWANKYAVGLDAISIGTSTYKIKGKEEHFTHKSRDGKVVMFLDSGSTRTILPQTVFDELKNILVTELKSGIESMTNKYKEKLTCFKAPSERPDMVLHFTGTEMHLPWENYMLKEPEGKSEFSCLAIHAHEGKSILGNFQQQNIHMLYDLTEGQKQPHDHGKLSFIQKDCGTYYHDVKSI